MGSWDEFLGNGILKGTDRIFIYGGWDDIDAVSEMSKRDMKTLGLSPMQQTALELRSYLLERSLLAYGDVLEESGKSLARLLQDRPSTLVSQYGMKPGHASRFLKYNKKKVNDGPRDSCVFTCSICSG